MLKHADYQIRSLNLINLQKSMHYNPFMYIHSEKDILKLVNTIIANTQGEAGSVMQMESWEDAREWLEGVVFDDPEVAEMSTKYCIRPK